MVTGANGMLGSELCQALSEQHEIVRTDITGDGLCLDIRETQAGFAAMESVRPDLVVHAAAMTDVDGCERDPDAAYRVNGGGTGNIAEAAARVGAGIIHISTDFVFDGEKGDPYVETDTPNPINHYGRSKLEGEHRVAAASAEYLIVRTAWMYGAHGKCFPRTIINAVKAGRELRVVEDQIGSPTYARDLAEAIAEMIDPPVWSVTAHVVSTDSTTTACPRAVASGHGRILHWTNAGSCSWYEFARKILELAGMGDVPVTPIPSSAWPSPTRRPRNSSLQTAADARPWEQALAEFVSEMQSLRDPVSYI